MSKTDCKYQPDAQYRYFYFDDGGDGFVYFKTPDERDVAANDAISYYLSDGWDECVENIVCGEVASKSTMVDKVNRPDDLDDEGCDGEGVYWDEYDYMCNYKLKPLGYVCPSTVESKQDEK